MSEIVKKIQKHIMIWISSIVSLIITVVIYILIKNKTGVMSFAITIPTPYINQFDRFVNLHNKFVYTDGAVVPAKQVSNRKVKIVTCKTDEEVINKVINKTSSLGSINKAGRSIPENVKVIDCASPLSIHYKTIKNDSFAEEMGIFLDDTELNNLITNKIGYHIDHKDIIDSIKDTHKDEFMFVEFANNEDMQSALDYSEIQGVVTHDSSLFNQYFDTEMPIYEPCVICLSENRDSNKALFDIAKDDYEYDEHMKINNKLTHNDSAAATACDSSMSSSVCSGASCSNVSCDIAHDKRKTHTSENHKQRANNLRSQLSNLKSKLNSRK